VIVRFLIVIS